MNEFDQWRSKYNSMTYKEQVAYHNDLEKRFPEQAHFNYGQAKKVLKNGDLVLEFGCWKGDLAQRAMNEFNYLNWYGIEICVDAIENGYKNIHYTVITPDKFDWWSTDQVNIASQMPYIKSMNVLIATHFIEHLSNQHFEELVQWFKGIPLVYFEAPLSMKGQSWEGYYGTHKLNYGWNKVIDIMKEAGYKAKELLHQAVIFEYE